MCGYRGIKTVRATIRLFSVSKIAYSISAFRPWTIAWRQLIWIDGSNGPDNDGTV